MNIPYGKVLIYVLTFIGYAYSGYGSSLLSVLRDAVLAAETTFGDFIENAIKVVENFKTMSDVLDAAANEECVFKCPGGETPKINKLYTPKADGCGSLGININPEFLPLMEMTKCCNAHDICYDTCNAKKETCDIEFKRCLSRYCESKVSSFGEQALKACKGAANIAATASLTLGCKPYLDSQKNACYCPEKRYNKNKYRGDEL